MIYKIPPLVVFGFAAGVFLNSFLGLGWPLALLIVVSAIFIFLFSLQKEGAVLLFVALFAFSFGLGFLRVVLKNASGISQTLKSQIGQKVFLKGFVSEEPDERENSARLIFKNETGDKILLVVRRYPEYFYGDVLEVAGALREIENFSDDFDYKGYLAKDDIFLQMAFPEITKTGAFAGSKLKSALLGVKKKYLEGLFASVSEPQASFLAALTVGARRSIPAEIIDDFRKSGIVHIIVLSGFHVTIVARTVAGIFATFLPHLLSSVLGLFGIFLFAIFTGASATVVRASIMASILYFAGLTGRVYQARAALFAAGFIMILANPKILRFDLGFQLSFLATAGILYLSPFVEKLILWLPEKLKIREYAKITISAQIAVTPLLIYAMGQFSLLAVPANVLVVWLVPFTMFFGFLTGAAGMVGGWLAALPAIPAYILSSYTIAVGSFFANLPLSYVGL